MKDAVYRIPDAEVDDIFFSKSLAVWKMSSLEKYSIAGERNFKCGRKIKIEKANNSAGERRNETGR